MKSLIDNIKADKITFRGFIISFIFLLLTLVFIIANYSKLPPFIPIFNQLPWGEARLTSQAGIFIPIIILALVFIVNLIFTSVVYQKNPLIARIVAAVTLIIAIMNFLFITKTVFTIT